ncbi:chloride channel protein [Pararobbsia silviterrae]|uniref:Chloride channel protein n=1 Tax=Pararobbsia silviterrae TaxID=1792498 RepID=A0A494Y3P3_9BURK|nr:chloride channel protein [Pararobbsia silviterrae]RKP56638.1 chloride channel protein [Pararobbsia silviterrae]
MFERIQYFQGRTYRHARRLTRKYGVFWVGAIVVGLVAVLYARLIDFGFDLFLRVAHTHFWLPLLITPAACAASVWLTRRFFNGAEGSGIPQVIATLQVGGRTMGERLLSLWIAAGKIAISFIAILGGMTIGREGPTVQVGAAIMFNLRRLYPRANPLIDRQLALAGAAAGLSAAFNTPLAGIVFAIEELSRSFEARASGVVITAVVFAGIVALGINGNYTYFGTLNVAGPFPRTMAVAVVVTAIVTGIAGGLFCWLLLNTRRWIPEPLQRMRADQPVRFAALCGLIVAIVGIVAGGATFGSGYTEARDLLDGGHALSMFYPVLKFASMIGSYLPGIPGGIFAPSLSIGAGIGNVLHTLFSSMSLPMLVGLAMVGYLAGVTQSPITAFVIVMEMINGHALVISLMATALISSRISRFFAPPLYEALSERYAASAHVRPEPAPAPEPEPESDPHASTAPEQPPH